MSTILHAIIGYFILLFAVRILRRRAGAQMTMYEYVLIFLLGGVIILSTVGNDRSVTNCTCAVIVVAFIHRTLAFAKSKSPRIGAILDGTPVVIIRKGEWQQNVIHNTGLRSQDIEAAARGMGLTRIEDIDYAILERNGSISVIKK
ncbi:DUF421 domain-containing protein [Occallatibacter riparius]|uniref:DUF421 domain-containing protein n=1 Tax=Occallatibacter riparius TaxID=1002689 RepID=A0A9J7BKW3_9BACT|nr:YetF domain-containing protein [Occallatibacter riparius]UWZ83287.1 DUF421 domain-containing protein [Occallatibacter riparius]